MKLRTILTLSIAAFVSAIFANLVHLPANAERSSVGDMPSSSLPHTNIVGPAGSEAFGTHVITLPNGNVVVADPMWDAPGPVTNVGAVYLIDGETLQINGRITGSSPEDKVGSGGVVALGNTGNFVIVSPNWNNGSAQRAGAVTWIDGDLAFPSQVTSANSLVGDSTDDSVGIEGVVVLPVNHNYVVHSPSWDSASGAINAGAYTWGSSQSGVTGNVSSANSLVGVARDDFAGRSTGTVHPLSNGNYVLCNAEWDNNGILDAGAATWVNGSIGLTGQITTGNSFYGTFAGQLACDWVTALTNGNFVISTRYRNEEGVWEMASRFAQGNQPVIGTVTPTNSFIGATSAVALTNGNYVVWGGHQGWLGSGGVRYGGVVWGNGTSGLTGRLSESNALYGTVSHGPVGSVIVPLSNGNYVVGSRLWDSGANGDRDIGAVTWGNGDGGTIGPVTAANSLIGVEDQSQVGYQITPLTDGNYVVYSPGVGLATWMNGNGPDTGTVSAGNSISGISVSDSTIRPVIATANGNYVVWSQGWSSSSESYVGALRFVKVTSGTTGVISPNNSITGSTSGDFYRLSVTSLPNGNVVASFPDWDNGPARDAGAVVFGSAQNPPVGQVSSNTAMLGIKWEDWVSFQTTDKLGVVLPNSDFVMLNPEFDWQEHLDAGAISVISGSQPTVGPLPLATTITGNAGWGGLAMTATYERMSRRVFVGRPRVSTVTVLGPFAAAEPTISGRVTDKTGTVGIPDVTISLTGTTSGQRVTDANGNYSFTDLTQGGNYTVTPSFGGAPFEPTHHTFTNLTGTNIGNFLTDPCKRRAVPQVDTDDDGLWDCWETDGIYFDDDGQVDLPIHAAPYNANPNRKDIFIEADYLSGSGHDSHRPLDDSIADVVRAFANAPVTNPDTTTGITLHVFIDEQIPESGNDKIGYAADPWNCGSFTDFDTLKNGFFMTAAERGGNNAPAVRNAKLLAFRYAIFGHALADSIPSGGGSCTPDTSGGIARNIPAVDFVVTLGSWGGSFPRLNGSNCIPGEPAARCGRRYVESGTFMHELGHTMGLRHGGGDSKNCKPNYLSVMNYSFQHPIISPNRKLDFSRNQLGTLDENALDETIGVASPQVTTTVYGVPVTTGGPILQSQTSPAATTIWKARITSASLPIDWNYSCAGNPAGCVYQTNVTADVNRIDSIPACKGQAGEPPHTILNGHNDWASALVYSPSQIPTAAWNALGSPDELREMTLEDTLTTAESADYDSDGASNANDNCPAVYNPGQADSNGNGIGDSCEVPASCPSITVSPGEGPLPTGNSGSSYSVSFARNGGVGNSTFTKSSGEFPNGLALNSSTGRLSGIPSQTGVFSFEIRVTDQNGCPASAAYTLEIGPGPVLRADFRLQGNLNNEVAGGPVLTELVGSGGATSFVNDSIDGYQRETLRFPFNSGVAVNSLGFPNSTATLVMLFKFDEVSGRRRLLDFTGGTAADNGVFLLDGRLEGESTANTASLANTYVQVVLVRTGTGTLRIYRDGILRIESPDGGSPLAAGIRFFQDVINNPIQESPGNLSRLRLYEGAMTPEQVQALDRVPEAPFGEMPILLFTSRNGTFELYRMNADGTSHRRLTSNMGSDIAGKFSPDGTKIVYQRRDAPTDPYQIWIANADGSGQVQLTNTPEANQSASWRPDGQKILFSTCSGGRCDLYTMNPDGSGIEPVTQANTTGDEDEARFTANGQKLVFKCSDTNGTNYQVCVANADGSGRQAITNTAAPLINQQIDVSPDGQRIAFVRSSASISGIAGFDIYTANIDGSNVTNITNNATSDQNPTWSPDGTKIMFTAARAGGINDIWLMNADGTGAVRLMQNSFDDRMSDWFRGTVAVRPPFDFDGDGKSDISIYRASNGQWWLNRSTAGLIVFTFGNSADILTPGDFTGDGKTDVSVFRPSTGEWFVLRSEDYTFYSFPFGTIGDVPVPADYDGDGKADAAVFRPSDSTWYIQRSSGGTMIGSFGAAGDRPVPADYDGDGKTDIAIYRPSEGQWWLNRSTAGVIVYTFGNSSDRNVPGDYTGDGKADVAIWRPSTGEWFILRSEDASFYSFPFGISTDVPVPGDYDGDGKFDAGVFRPSNGTWYLNRSTAGLLIQGFGLGSDIPVPSAFVR